MVEISRAPLSEWMDSQIGPGRMFLRESAWAKKATISTSTFNAIRDRGSGEPTNLMKIARAANRNPLDIFEMAGLLTPEEVEEITGRKEPSQIQGARQAIELLELVPEGRERQRFLVNMRALAEAARSLVPQSQDRPRTPHRVTT